MKTNLRGKVLVLHVNGLFPEILLVEGIFSRFLCPDSRTCNLKQSDCAIKRRLAA